jgi:membrane peptidoglycan carboxypeptidase
VSSKADDFDVRYRGVRDGPGWDNGTDGGYSVSGHQVLGNGEDPGGTVDYDLGYGASGWDTQGFRIPGAGDHDGEATGSTGQAAGHGNGRTPWGLRSGSHARTTGQEDLEPLTWEPDAPGSTGPWLPDPGSPGPAGPGRRGPGGRDRSRVKVKGSWWRHWTLRKALGVALGIIGGLVVLCAIAVVVAYEQTPVPTEAMAATGYAQTVVYSSNGTLIGRFGTTNRQQLPYDQIPAKIIDAVLAAEDRHYLTEGGISPTGIVRAAIADLTGSDGSLQGGSTITQQFVRNYYQGIGTQQTVSRKLKEIFVSMKIAKEKSKQWILENYLNTIFLGDGAYGVEAAAQTYFDKPVSQLSWEQDAVIAALIQQPSTYPLPQYRPQLEARWSYVINGLVQMGDLTAQQAATMTFPKIGDFVPQSFGRDVWDPYILNMVYNELRQVYGFSWSQIYDGGYVIRTTIDDAKMAALYQAVSQNEAQIDSGSPSFQSFMHVGAVLEDPATGAIQALYPGPGYPGWKYNGTGKVITKRYCKQIYCDVNLAVYSREQVGSSFKPYILATAVKQGMNVQTSTLDGYNYVCIPPDFDPTAYPSPPVTGTLCPDSGHLISNDNAGENGPYTPQAAMAASINTAYSDLWHVVAGRGSETVANNVGQVAQAFGVDTDAAGITGPNDMQDLAGVTLGQASLTVGEQASMLATIDDYGVYHDPHVISSITRNGVPTPVKITSRLVFSPDPTLNQDEATQVQYAMSADTAPGGTAPTAAMSDGQEVIAKTGTTENAESAFFIGAIPTQALAVGMFTSEQDNKVGGESLNNLGGDSQGGFGGTWPAAIWHAYAENMFLPLGVEPFQPPVFTGSQWNLIPPGLRQVAKPHRNHHLPGGQPMPPPSQLFPSYRPSGIPTGPPFGGGNTQAVNATAAGVAVGGVSAALPVALLWVRRRTRGRGRMIRQRPWRG